MSTSNGIDVIGEVSEPEYSPDDFDSMEGYLSNQFDSEAYRAEDVIDDETNVAKQDIEQGDTFMVVQEGGMRQAYVVDGPVQAPQVGDTDEVVDYGVIGTGEASATANQYDFEVVDNVNAMYGTNVAAGNKNFQKRDETTDVSLEFGDERDERVQRAMDNFEPTMPPHRLNYQHDREKSEQLQYPLRPRAGVPVQVLQVLDQYVSVFLLIQVLCRRTGVSAAPWHNGHRRFLGTLAS